MPSEDFTFPSPVGGAPLPVDYAPSILFAVLYGLLIPVGFYRIIDKKSRNIVLIGTIAFAIERVVVMSLRSEQARSEQKRMSDSLTVYMQTTLGIGYFAMASDLANLLRCLLVAATAPPAPSSSPSDHFRSESTEELTADAYLMAEESRKSDYAVDDRKTERTWYRRICGFTGLFSLIPLGIGLFAAGHYAKAEEDEENAQLVQILRYTSTILSTLLILVIQGMAIYGIACTRNAIKSSAAIILSLATLLNVVSVYRLFVMHFQTTSLTSDDHGSLNSTFAKTCFYIFQLSPEWICAAVLLGLNIPKRFKTGMWGDRSLKKKAKTPGQNGR